MGLVGVADLLGVSELRALAELQAAELLESLGDDLGARRLFRRAAASVDLGLGLGLGSGPGPALGGVARTALRLGELDAVEGALTRARAAGITAEPGLLRDWRVLRGPGIALDFTRPLARAWSFPRPQDLRRTQGALEIDGLGALGDVEPIVLEGALSPLGGALALAVDVDVDLLEWGGALEAEVLPNRAVRAVRAAAEAGAGAQIALSHLGGDFQRHYRLECSYGHQKLKVLLPFESAEREPRLGRLRARLSVLPGLGEWACLIERPGGEVLVAERLPLEGAMAVDDLLFQLRIIGSKSSRVRAVLHRLEIAGVRLQEGRSHSPGDADAAAEAAAEVARRRVEGDRLGSLAALAALPEPSPSDRLLEVALLAELGRWGEARLRLAALLGGGSGPSTAAAEGAEFSAIERDLFSLLRLEPALYSGLLRDVVGPAEQRRIFVQAWYWVIGMNASVANCVAVERGLAEVDRAEDPFEVLLIHAAASKCRGRLAAAEASYRAALGAFNNPRLGTTASSPAMSSIWRSGITVDLLELAVAMGEPARAEAMLRDLLNGVHGGPEPDLALIDRVLAHPELRSLWRSAAAAEKMSSGTD